MCAADRLESARWPWIALFGVAFAPLIHDALIEKFFSADGAYYFQQLLEGGHFTDFAWARNHSVYLVQWPVVLAVRAGVADWTTLETLFAVGLLLPFVVGFALSVIARRGLPAWPLLFPIASLLVITIPADYLLVGEHHVLVALAWPVLFFALRPVPPRGWELGLLAVLALILTRTYESAVLVSPVLAAACLIRSRREPPSRQGLWIAVAAVLLIGAAMAAYSILFPRDPGNRAAFLQSLAAPARRLPVLIGLGFLVPFVLALRQPRRHPLWLAISLGALGIVSALAAASAIPGGASLSGPVWAGDSFASRTLSMTLLPPLLAGAGVLLWQGDRVRLTRAHVAAFCVFTCVVCLVSLHENRQWVAFRSAFRTVLATRTGFVPIETTPLADDPAGWPWNNAILSYLWSDDAVRAIVLNRRDVGWEPFDPRTSAILERYRDRPPFLEP